MAHPAGSRHARETMTSRSGLAVAVAVLLAAGMMSVVPPPRASAAATTLYVDGKHGSDSNTGLSWAAAFRTINRAARQVPHGSAAAGWMVIVRGYADYIYRERPVPGGYDRWGTSTAPLVFSAEGWAAGSTTYVKPIVSGGLVAPQAGRVWQADATSGIWYTGWDQPPAGFDATKPYSSAIFQGGTSWLWQHASLADLRLKASSGNGGYWYDASAHRLYVATRNGVAAGSVQIDVPTNKGFYFDGSYGASYISVRGFIVQHSEMGIAFYLGTDHGSALDDVANANYPMGFATSGRVTGSSSFDPALGNDFERDAAAYNTLQGFKVDAGSQGTIICHSDVRLNAVQGIKVLGSLTGAADPRVTSGTEICHNVLAQQATQRPGASRSDEEPNGLTVANGATGTYVHENSIHDNVMGVQVNQRGVGSPISNTRFSGNLVYANSSVGLNISDGASSAAAGTGSFLGAHNLYWDNGVGIRVHPGSTNKTFDRETVYANKGSGIWAGCTCSAARSSVTIGRSLVTNNAAFGVRADPGADLHVSSAGLTGNASGATSGTVVKYAVNTQAAGYLSRDPASVDFLRINTSSYQYTAGPAGEPIGARY
jgi:hypothetical protein